MDLFEHRSQHDPTGVPLAERMRPRGLGDIVGQPDLLGAGRLLGRGLAQGRVPSMMLWGPPGTGKTTLARAIAQSANATFVPFSAVLGGVPELRAIIREAEERRRVYAKATILFIDEIHRFNKAQQDALLPHVERGTVTLIGATTENPSFAVNAALLSRTRVFRFEPLTPDDIRTIVTRALTDTTHGLGALGLTIHDDALAALVETSRGDARRALNGLELAAEEAAAAGVKELSRDLVEQALATRTLLYDKAGEEHYNVVSAFIKSMRGSDAEAATYWMMRMVEAGDDPRFITRRMMIFASEDVGNADPHALPLAVSADAAVERLGLPEALYPMAQCCTYLAAAPKSNATALAWKKAQDDVRTHGPLPVPRKLRNAVTGHMKAWGYGEGYRYPHDEGGIAAGETYLPDALVKSKIVRP